MQPRRLPCLLPTQWQRFLHSITLENDPPRTGIRAQIPPEFRAIFSARNWDQRLDRRRFTDLRSGSFRAYEVAGNRYHHLYRSNNPERRPKPYDCMERRPRHSRHICAHSHRTHTVAWNYPLSGTHEVDTRPRSTSPSMRPARLRAYHEIAGPRLPAVSFERLIIPLPNHLTTT